MSEGGSVRAAFAGALLLWACAPASAQDIRNWSDFQRYCSAQGGVAAKASGGRGPTCTPGSSGGGGGTSSYDQMRLNLAAQAGALLGQWLVNSMTANPEQEAQRRAAEERAREEARRAQIAHMKAEEARKDAIRDRLLASLKGVEAAPQLTFKGLDSAPSPGFRLDTPSRWSASPADAPPQSSGLQFRFGDAPAPQASTLAQLPADSAMAQLTRAAYYSELALAAPTPEEAKAFADAAFDGTLGLPVNVPVPGSVPVRNVDVSGVEGARKQYRQSSERSQESFARVSDAEQQREIAERVLKEARARVAPAAKLSPSESDNARKIAQEAQELFEAQEKRLHEAYADALNGQAVVAVSAKVVLDVLDPGRTRGPVSEGLGKRAYLRGIQDASRCIQENSAAYCSVALQFPGTQECVSGYKEGYGAGNRIREKSLQEAFEIGRQAKQSDNLHIGSNHPKAVGACQGEWMEAFYRGYHHRAYVFSGNGLIGGTTWISGYNAPANASAELRRTAMEAVRTQATRAGMNYDEAIDFDKYRFVLGIAASHSAPLDLAGRVLADEFTLGHRSQSQPLYASLKNRAFNELACHSNGAMICLAALRSEDIRAKKVILYGPQITPESLNRWEELVRQRKIESVSIVINQGDPVPALAMAVGGSLDRSVLPNTALLHAGVLRDYIRVTNPLLQVQSSPCGGMLPELLAPTRCHELSAYRGVR